MNEETKDNKSAIAECWEKFCYNYAPKTIFIGFLLAVIVIGILISDYRPFITNKPEEKVKIINDLILTLSCGYVASFIFFLVQDFIPHLRDRKSTKEYVHGQIGYINTLLRNEVERQFFFEISDEKDRNIDRYVDKFAKDDLFSPMKELNGKSRYDVLKNDEKRIKEIAKELLRRYGSYLNYDEVKQLEYLNNEYKIDPLLSNHLIELNGKVGIDDRFTRAQAVKIYKAYDIMRQKRFRIPRYSIEDKLAKELGLT